MPEIKNNFVQGKMNKDLDERLLPNGQYRDAMNIEVSTSESSNVGVVQNILGNYRVEDIVGTGFTCVGAIADEKTNKIYWFISKYSKDAIIEYDVENSTAENPIVKPVLVDLYAGTYKAVLKFTGNIITGINIIDNLLFWTDNYGEPKKINIDECKKGTPDINTHTQLVFDNGSFNGITIECVTPWSGSSTNHIDHFALGGLKAQYVSRYKKGRNVWFEAKHMKAMLNIDEYSTYDETIDLYQNVVTYTDGLENNGYRAELKHYRDGKFLGIRRVLIGGIARCRMVIDQWQYDTASGYPEDRGTPISPNPYWVNGTPAGSEEEANQLLWHVGDVLFGNNVSIDIEERHITVIKPKPLNVLSVKINHNEAVDNTQITQGSGHNNPTTADVPNLFETKFPRFSYRYKYKDGEYSAFAPFTAPVFNPKYPKDPSVFSDGDVFYNKDNAYNIDEPYNKAMINSISSIYLSGFINAKTPEDVIEVEILYKQEESNVIYSIDTIKHIDSDWHKNNIHEGLSLNLGFGKEDGGPTAQDGISTSPDGGSNSYKTEGSLTKGRYKVTKENIYAALPANQLLRPYDNVPKKAKAQEITGSRIVYGNYVQNYDLLEDAQVSISYSDRKVNISSFESKGLPSIKSQRNYQVGVIYCDKFGRETPVFTSKDAAVNIPWQDSIGNKNASKTLQLNTGAVANFPEWVDSLKFFIKENSNQYYNLVMDRAWVAKSTYDLDNSEGHLWLSFPSSDRNKLTEDDYIILKKKIGTGEDQVSFENKYRVIDIQNEAPDALKFQLVNYGVAPNTAASGSTNTGQGNLTNTGAVTDSLFYNENYRPDKQINKLLISREGWETDFGTFTDFRSDLGIRDEGVKEGLYVSWRRIGDDNSASKKYKVVGGRNPSNGNIVLNLERNISKQDADIAHIFGDSLQTAQPTTGPHASGGSDPRNPEFLHEDLVFQIERREPKELEEYSGKFFVKISKNQVTDLIESGNITDITKQYQVTSAAKSFAWRDALGSQAHVESPNYGITNYNGADTQAFNTIRFIQNADNNSIGRVAADGSQASQSLLFVSDYAEPWAGIQTQLNTNGHGMGHFFIDMMHMAAGQSNTSDYAKYCCVTWSGTVRDNGNYTFDNETASLPQDSSWSYPPLKTWITEYDNIANLIIPESTQQHNDEQITIPAESVWYENNFITTTPILQANSLYNGLRVDGWVGPLQNVSREWFDNPPLYSGVTNERHVNGLEGLVTTTDMHAVGPRRWFSGMNGTDYGVGVDTKTYSINDEVGRHFMHLSFFAPGKDLHDGEFGDMSGQSIYGTNAWMNKLQGIWGGGVFTGKSQEQTFGGGHYHLPMEGNYAPYNNYIIEEPPGPGVGYGYDTDYRELHERQWDPTFTENGDPDNEIRDFIRNLHAGAKFRFNRKFNGSGDNISAPIIDTEIYTIKSVQIKKLYNHTSWRTAYNRFTAFPNSGGPGYLNIENEHWAYQSVEEVALRWLDNVDATGTSALGASTTNGSVDPTNAYPLTRDFEQKIVDFGAAHNRRICYIIELDKNPANSTSNMGNPLTQANVMNADFDANNYAHIEFLDPVKDVLLSDLSKFPAIWEVDPKKQEVDLDIYYEAGNSIPVKLNEQTCDLFAPPGCKVEVLNSVVSAGVTCTLNSWDGSTATLHPGLPKDDGASIEIDYTGVSFKFIREDGSYTIAEADVQVLDGIVTSPNDPEPLKKTTFKFREDIADVIASGLNWYNCFSFGNGIESNRIRDDFNEPFITNGVKASTSITEPYREERRKSGLIYSGIYNSSSGINDLNQFIMAEKITKDLNPTYGSIQKLFQRRISLIAFCEDRVVSIVSNKDTIFNADGNPQLVSSDKVLGDANPFVGNYGISKNPESFASESYRAYFTDKQRGAVLRLSKDGLTPISDAGMKDWFRDNLPEYGALIGTYDSYKNHYNVSLTNDPGFYENLVVNAYFDMGPADSGSGIGQESLFNIIQNQGPTGTSLQYLWENPSYPVLDFSGFGSSSIANPFSWPAFSQNDYDFLGSAKIVHHQAIPYGSLQPYIAAVSAGTPTTATPTAFAGANSLTDNGWWYDPRFTNPGSATTGSGDIFGSSAANNMDAQVGSVITRVIEDPDGSMVTINEGSSASEPILANPFGYDLATSSFYTHAGTPGAGAGGVSANWNPTVEKIVGKTSGGQIGWPSNTFTTLSTPDYHVREVSSVITRNYNSHAIVFDRTRKGSYIELSGIGDSFGTNLFDTYNANAGTSVPHKAFFNGEELHIQLELTIFKSVTDNVPGSNPAELGYNYIAPRIRIYDGNNLVPTDKLIVRGNLTSFPDNDGNSNVISTDTDHAFSRWITNPGGGYGMNQEMLTVNGAHPLVPGLEYADYSPQTPEFPRDYQLVYNPFQGGYENIQGSPTVQFPNTDTIAAQTESNAYYASISGDINIVIGCSFKFRDPAQQNVDGSSITGVYEDITPVQVINDLRIRIDQTADPYNGTDTRYYDMEYPGASFDPRFSSASDDYPMTRPLWEIKSIRCKKGVGIISGSTTAGTTTTAEVEVEAVPPYDVPAWTEVINSGHYGFDGNNDWKFLGASYAPGQVVGYSQQHTTTVFGNNYPFVTQTGYKQNNDPAVSPVDPANLIEYQVPRDWGYDNSTSQDQNGNIFTYTSLVNSNGNPPQNGSPYGTTGSTRTITTPETTLGPHGTIFNRVNSSNNTYSYTDVTWPNKYTYIANFTGTNRDHQLMQHSGLVNQAKWKSSDWYLVDIEFSPNSGASSGGVLQSGDVYIVGITGVNAPAALDYTSIDPVNGVGTYGQNLVMHNGSQYKELIRLEQFNRFRYGTSQNVLRAIFKPHPNSSVVLNESENIDILFTNFQGAANHIRVRKIICKKLSGSYIWDNWLTTNGKAANWLENVGVQDLANPVHAFDTKYLYYYNGTLTWQIGNTPPGNTGWQTSADLYDWTQDLSTPCWLSPSNWTLTFTINENAYTNYGPQGSLRGLVTTSNPAAISLSGSTEIHEGVYFEGIDQTGHYKINFNFDGANSINTWTFERADLGTPTAFATHTNGTLSTTSASFPASSLPSYLSPSDITDKIKFYPEEVFTEHEYALSNIILTDNTPIFIGGGASGGWTFSGFNTSLYNYIYWDFQNEHLTFLACPVAVEDNDVQFQQFINVSQPIDAPINRYEKYKISFTHGITDNSTATLALYYYNSLGFGFKIAGINNNTPGFIPIDPATGLVDYTNYPNVAPFELIVTIGDPQVLTFATSQTVVNASTGETEYILGPSSWSSINEIDPAFNPDIKNSFVVQVEGSLDDEDTLFGYIDNLVMLRVFDATEAIDTTVSFSESVNGWTSFKSFIAENGVSVSKKYFTFNDGMLYQHYIPLKDGINGETDAAGVFQEYTLEEANNYNQFYDNINGLSSVTAVLNQEPSLVKMFNTINYEGTQAYAVEPSNPSQITINNVAAWKASEDILGWQCANIQTDLDQGSIDEFIKKEGKWFNYIRGLKTSAAGVRDTSLFSVQGVGIINSVVDISTARTGTSSPVGMASEITGVLSDIDQIESNINGREDRSRIVPRTTRRTGGGSGGGSGY